MNMKKTLDILLFFVVTIMVGFPLWLEIFDFIYTGSWSLNPIRLRLAFVGSILYIILTILSILVTVAETREKGNGE